MTTLKMEILVQYKALTEHILAETGSKLFPELGQVDATDIVCMVVQFFGGSRDGDYRGTLLTMARLRGVAVSVDDMEKVYPQIKDFIDFVLDRARRT
jgi:hypothetical protein